MFTLLGKLSAVLWLGIALPAAQAQSCSSKSPAHTVALIELFTSEGCSSCPPADRWLQGLAGKRDLFDRIVPLSLHVGYWDYIGWKDPFAQAGFTARQREYARLRGSGTVYTPQVVLSGKDFPAWDTAAFERTVAQKGQTRSGAQVQFTANASANSISVSGALQAADPALDLQVHFVVFEMGLRSKVTRGENSGALLTHDFVVRHWNPPLITKFGRWAGDTTILLDAAKVGAVPRNLGIAALVQSAKGDVVQATACLLRS
jgi:hypothetical protein